MKCTWGYLQEERETFQSLEILADFQWKKLGLPQQAVYVEKEQRKKKNLTVQQSRKYAGIWILATTSHWWVWPGTGSSPFWASVQQFKNKGLAQMSSTGPSSSALLLGLTIWGIIPYLWFLLQDVMGKKERPSALSWPKLLSDFGGWLCSSEHWDSLCREPC